MRIHGTTRKQPVALFELERAWLLALPPAVPDLASWHRVSVHRDCHIQFERVLYSAPFTLVGMQLWLCAIDGAVALYDELRHVYTHALAASGSAHDGARPPAPRARKRVGLLRP